MERSYIPVTSVSSGVGQNVTPDLYCYCIQVVNVCFIGHVDGTDGWVLVDAGMPKSTNEILAAAEARFGANRPPSAILLTHGHFDHVGALLDLAAHWDVPVYAHELEFPYLTGQSNYPEPDPTVEGGMVAKLSPLFPNEAIDVGQHLQKLPSDGSIPGLPEWRWIHTPGHSPGHVSFFRESDRSLVAGDAFINVRQDSLFKVVTQTQELSGPPRYLTTDWEAARESVRKLAEVKPAVAITGHGLPLSGEMLSPGLDKLVRDFDRVAVPDYGRYVKVPDV
ncbi:MBL fold metallo-hydrolase [Brevibacillus choshinensis]|uniref:MBL fold metallo-hydrolase n=1 Tax=Brevibacillus choshinensis TaxID=54911 RepID=A0ABX7FVJ5_BRECH|nr:MBL fold metallo-hydrolase [Brevibacillus choshinensis]QRG69307.1 MBL fold metallo-hydrolase [Brevibacillus choshinensis]